MQTNTQNLSVEVYYVHVTFDIIQWSHHVHSLEYVY